MAGSERCCVHQRPGPTAAEQAASRTNPVQHGDFVRGFLDEGERAIFDAVLEGHLDPGELTQHEIAALMTQADRMMAWEAQSREVQGAPRGC